jgi:hypothetical protein
VPIPVPVRDLEQVVEWLEQSMVPDGQNITSLTVDGRSVIDILADRRLCSKTKLSEQTSVEVRIETPLDLALQSLETAHSLCRAILGTIKVVAVNLWQALPTESDTELSQLLDDTELVCDLIDHARDLGVGATVDFGKLQELQSRIRTLISDTQKSRNELQWRTCAQLLLRDSSNAHSMESALRILQDEFESAHLRLLTSRVALTAAR